MYQQEEKRKGDSPDLANSAYASAESSPNQSLTPSHSNSSFTLSINEKNSLVDVLPNTKQYSTQQSQMPTSLSTASGFNNLNKLEEYMMANTEFQSLPSTLKKDECVKDIIDKTVKTTMQTTSPKPTESPISKSSVLSFIENLLVKPSKSSQNLSSKSPEQTSTAKPAITKPTTHLNPHDALSKSNLSTTSSSSPNPECSPFKLLVNELPASTSAHQMQSPSYQAANNKPVSTLSPNGTTINDAVAIFNAAMSSDAKKSEPESNKIIENLAMLNRKEHEKADPVLSASNQAKTQTEAGGVPSMSKPAIATTTTTTVSAAKEIKQNESSNNSMNVPSSSREFCLNLNFNLAAAAAGLAAAPLAIVDTSSQTIPNDPSKRFTSNASTSSIHNDLKIILEEGKKMDKQQEPKPQRTNAHHHYNQHKHTNKSSNDSIEKKLKQLNDQPTSPTKSNLNIIKMMMMMTGNESNNGRYRYSKEFLHKVREERAEFIDNIYPDIFKAYCYCMNGKYWDPEKYFDIVQFPGEYEKVVQQKNQYNNKNHRSNNYQKGNAQNKKKSLSTSQMNSEPTKSATEGDLNACLNTIDSPEPLQVPKNSPKNQQQTHHQRNGKDSKKKTNSILSGLGLVEPKQPTSDAQKMNPDKLLLGLIKPNSSKEKSPNANNNVDLLDMLNKKSAPISTKSKSSHNILAGLFNDQHKQTASARPAASAPRHYPSIFTAQELEMSQLNQASNKQNQHKRSTQNEKSIGELESTLRNDLSSLDLNNNTSAYKQLVKNLNNHPLSVQNNKNSSVEDVIIKFQQKRLLQQQQAQLTSSMSLNNISESSTILKQLLNIDNKIDEQPSTSEKKSKSKKHHQHGQHKKHTKTSKSHHDIAKSNENKSLQQKFPSVNPHEKPFQAFFAEQNAPAQKADPLENLLNKMKHQEQQRPIQAKHEVDMRKKKSYSTSTEYDNFNTLLNKIMPSLAGQEQPQNRQALPKNQHQYQNKSESSNDILKWFNGAPSKTVQKSATFTPAMLLTEVDIMRK